MTSLLPAIFSPTAFVAATLSPATLFDTVIPLRARITGIQRIRMTYEGFSPAKVWYLYVIGGGVWVSGMKSEKTVYQVSEAYPPAYGCVLTEFRNPTKNYDSAIRVQELLTGTFITLDFSFSSTLDLLPTVSLPAGGGEINAPLTIDVETWTFPPQHYLGVGGGVSGGSPPRKEFVASLSSGTLDSGVGVPIPRHVGPQLVQLRVELAGFQMDWCEFYLCYGYRDVNDGYVGLPTAQANPEIYKPWRCTVAQTSVDSLAKEQNRTYAIYLTAHTFSLTVKPSSSRAEPPLLYLLSAPLGLEVVKVSITRPYVTDWC
jgi:hypothetical protein